FLAVMKPNQRVQVQWDGNGSFRRPLLKFRAATSELAKNAWTERVRNEIFVRGWSMEEEGLVRREQLRVYFTMPVEGEALGARRSALSLASLLDAYQQE